MVIKETDGEIENLIVFLGANACLGTVVKLEMKETEDDPPGAWSEYTLWSKSAFEKEYVKLADYVRRISAKNVYVATVPHVTIPPITRGVMKGGGELRPGETYFDYYTRYSIREDDFDPETDPHVTKAQAEAIDNRIDFYNETIGGIAAQYGWHVVDVCDVLDKLAVRRNHGQPSYEMPQELRDLDLRFFEIDKSGRIKSGGLIGLDGARESIVARHRDHLHAAGTTSTRRGAGPSRAIAVCGSLGSSA